jgi:Glycosyltransferase family 87
MTVRSVFEAIFKLINLTFLVAGTALIAYSVSKAINQPFSGSGPPVGIDFFCFWSAGRMTLDGNVLSVFNVESLSAFQKNYFQASVPVSLPWFYPPLLLLYISCLFAVMPYEVAYLVFLFVSFVAYIGFVKIIFPNVNLIFVLGFPAFWFNLLLGQNGLLTAGLLVGGLVLLSRSGWVSGAMLAMLSYKPQFCFAIPFFLLVEKRFQVIVAGVMTLVGLLLFSTLLFGSEVWSAFLVGLGEAQNYNQLSGRVPPHTLANLYGTLKSAGLSHTAAMQMNYLFALTAGLAAIRVWILSDEAHVKNSLVILMTLLLAPHLHHYEFVVTGAVIIWLWPRVNLRPALCMLWAAPMTWLMLPPPGFPMLSVASALIIGQLNLELRQPFART